MTIQSRNLSPLFSFGSMAFVGASDSNHFGRGAFLAKSDIGFSGAYYPVNPKRPEVHGTQAYPSVADIPGTVDAAVIAVSREHVIPAVRQAADKGVKALVVLSGNFAEGDAEGQRLQDELRDLVRRKNILLVGPNCMGAFSVANGCALYQGRGLDVALKGNISVVAQSGGLMNEFLHLASSRSLGFAHMVSCGNEADVTAAEYLDYYVSDAATDVIVAIIETVREPDLFLSALDRAAAAGKPVIVLKLGASEKGAQSALTHTGALAGNDAVWDALLVQKAATRAHDIDELVDLCALFSRIGKRLAQRPLERAGVIEISGGSCELVCDLAEKAGVELPEPNAESVAAIAPTTQDFLSVHNPVDTGFLWINPAMGTVYPAALKAFGSQDDMDIVVSRYIVPPDTPLGALNDRLDELEMARAAHPDRLFVVASPTSNQFHPEWRAALAERSIAFVPGFGRAFRALGKLAAYSRRIRAWSAPPALQRVASVGESVQTTILNEVEAKQLLAVSGLPVIDTRLAATAAEALEAARQIGFPVAAKVMSPQMTHKSDVGGVRLNIADEHALTNAYEDFVRLVENTPGAVFEGVSVQAMAKPGVELVLGAHRDEQFGPVILFGLGGIFVEVLKDTVLRVAPLTRADAEEMVEGIRAAALLNGARGKPPLDKAAIVDALLALSSLMTQRGDIDSVDVNPAFAYPDGLAVADARIVIRVSDGDDITTPLGEMEPAA